MATVMFWEKPGCAGNARQKALLRASGHIVHAIDLRRENWAAETLRPFFGSKPVAEWFNRSSPRVKSGEVVPEMLSETDALALMQAEPLLIRRPLMQVEDRRESGFDAAMVAQWIGLDDTRATVDESCQRETAGGCAVAQ